MRALLSVFCVEWLRHFGPKVCSPRASGFLSVGQGRPEQSPPNCQGQPVRARCLQDHGGRPLRRQQPVVKRHHRLSNPSCLALFVIPTLLLQATRTRVPHGLGLALGAIAGG